MPRRPLILALAASLLFAAPLSARELAPILSAEARFHPVVAENGMVASQEALATRVGVDILKAGGNAVDAAVAVGFALAVTLPRAGNLGGGGFMLVHRADRAETVAIDYRETAPAAAHRDIFLDDAGNADAQKSRHSALAVGVPGTVAGLALAHQRYGSGRFALADLIAPAIRLAEEGFVVGPGLARSLARAAPRLTGDAEAKRIFYDADGTPPAIGTILRQPDLAASLKAIAAGGPDAFYRGPIGEKIAVALEGRGGIMTADDLAAYAARVRAPVRGRYRGYEIASMPPPSSGGVHLLQILNMLDAAPIGERGPNSAATIHLFAEAARRAYADRARYLGDPDFVDVPVARLTDPAYAGRLAATISPERATPSDEIVAGALIDAESNETTHFSVVDAAGNAVANTYTLNFSYGVGIVAEGTGILLNNELDDFSAKPGVPNAYGLIGAEANAVAANKRPLSSMTPTLVFKDGRILLATGSPGGSLIITTVAQIVINVIDHGMNIAEATAAPRVHHQWRPDEIRIERGLSPDTIRLLETRGHKISQGRAMGSTQSILKIGDELTGAADPRSDGALAAGY